ncbi:energy-coupling factor ABC transporter permease, partial [Janibacter sp. RAF20_2_2]
VRVFVGVAVADLATYVTTATQLALAYPEGGFVEAWGRFLGIFAVTQVPLAIVEGLVGVLLINALIAWARPEMEDLEVVPAETKEPARA